MLSACGLALDKLCLSYVKTPILCTQSTAEKRLPSYIASFIDRLSTAFTSSTLLLTQAQSTKRPWSTPACAHNPQDILIQINLLKDL